MNIRNILALLLTALLIMCAAAACAEETADTAPLAEQLMQVKIGGKTYSFAAPLEELTAQGITINASELKPDYWYTANNGRASFEVLLTATHGDSSKLSVSGITIRPKDNQTYELYGGVVIGPQQGTREEICASFGKKPSEYSYDGMNFCNNQVSVTVSYDDEGMWERVQIDSDIPSAYGFEYSELAGAAQENLPDPKTMAFDEYIIDGKLYKGKITLADLEANGWLADVTVGLNTSVEPQGNDIFVSNPVIDCYNGRGMLRVFPINRSTTDTCKLSECGVLYVGVGKSNDVDVVLADGITLGSPYADAVAVFGEASYTRDESDKGYIMYRHNVVNSMTYEFSVTDGVITYIQIQP